MNKIKLSELKSRIIISVALLVVLLGAGTASNVGVLASSVSAPGPSLRTSEPIDRIIADLEEFIPVYMRHEGIPGVSVALIRDRKVVWTEGFGVTNTITRQPVTEETLFKVASNSKVITAYIALRLVDQGMLSLDEPLNDYLSEPWLPQSEYREAVNLRQVLSHSSGLGHGTLDRELRFVPGSGYSYSVVGFHYLQAVLEQVSGQSLEDLAQEMVFKPLGMSSSSFVNHAAINPRTANGHMRAAIPAFLFVIPFVVCLVLLGFVGLVVLRRRTGRWRPTRRKVVVVFLMAILVTNLLVLILFGGIGWLDYAWLISLFGSALAIVFVLAFVTGQEILNRLFPGRAGLQNTLTVMWGVAIIVGLVMLVRSVANLPVPKSLPVEASAAGTVRATARDLATFLIELSDPSYLSEDLAAQLRTPQVELDWDLSWGLGPGIQHSQDGDALWQWGQAPDFQSVMIIYPEQGAGVVVFTNSDQLNPDVAIRIAHRALGGKIEPLRRATHLEFNYDGPYLDE